ncbi:hypothetical protein A5679_17385 [Mycobacterium scrofulaceum]|uniref:Uncharacterized protein n=1 Tax=Mycobacterium scrofulaceum TaxID=1783 RepID=A0A1A2VQQ2_MYCSC|nr:hypothetical protein A5679_17385 [Mycobacterium scrofulaceum]
MAAERLPGYLRCAACQAAWNARPDSREARREIARQARRITEQAREMGEQHPGLNDPDLPARVALDAQLDAAQQRLQHEYDDDPIGFIWRSDRP